MFGTGYSRFCSIYFCESWFMSLMHTGYYNPQQEPQGQSNVLSVM